MYLGEGVYVGVGVGEGVDVGVGEGVGVGMPVGVSIALARGCEDLCRGSVRQGKWGRTHWGGSI